MVTNFFSVEERMHCMQANLKASEFSLNCDSAITNAYEHQKCNAGRPACDTCIDLGRPNNCSYDATEK
jgi:hypothetical protein